MTDRRASALWQNTRREEDGGEHNDYLYDILLLADGGTLLAGQANNTGFSHRITPGNARLFADFMT